MNTTPAPTNRPGQILSLSLPPVVSRGDFPTAFWNAWTEQRNKERQHAYDCIVNGKKIIGCQCFEGLGSIM